MAFAKGKFGVEFDPEPEEKSPSGLRLVVGIVLAAAAVSLAVTLFSRFKGHVAEKRDAEKQAAVQPPPAAARKPAKTAEKPEEKIKVETPEKRPAKARNLLMRLEEAEKSRDLVLIVTTIEQLRALPGKPLADIDDSLARRLGALNVQWLFEYSNAQWVKRVKVKAGDSATRIAREHGSTLASFVRLNPGIDAGKLKIGMEVGVMNRPRLNLVVSARSRTADLHLNGKFFKRYDLALGTSARPGAYEVGPSPRSTLAECGVAVGSKEERAELESLLPKGSSITVSDM
jgi:LysM repeat protein